MLSQDKTTLDCAAKFAYPNIPNSLHYKCTGMAVAEIVSEKLNPNLETKLKFTYDSMEIFNELKSLTSSPTVPGVHAYQSVDTVDISADVTDTVNSDKSTANEVQ